MASSGFDIDKEARDPALFSVHEGLSVNLVPAPFLKRALAAALDLSIVSLAVQFALIPLVFVLIVVGAMSATLLQGLKNLEMAAIIAAAGVLLFLLLLSAGITHGYFIWFEKKKAQTPGKKLFGLKVISLDGGNLTYGQCCTREFFRYIDGLLFLPGVISILLTDKHQRIGDLAAGTMVTYSAKSESRNDHLYLRADEFAMLEKEWPGTTLGGEMDDRFLSFANRRYLLGDTSLDVNAQADYWFQHLQQVLQEPRPVITDRDRFLRFMAEKCFQRKRGL